MKRRGIWAAFPALALAVFAAGSAAAADHADSPRAAGDPAADLTDIYAWMSEDASKLILVLDIPGAEFSDAVQYVFHLSSMAGYAQAPTPVDVICTFDAAQKITCWAGEEDSVTGDASVPFGLSSESGRMRVYAGRRSDPFFFNGAGFSATIAVVKSAAPNLTFDMSGCPRLDSATSGVLVRQLSTDPRGAPAKNFFDGNIVSSLVIELDKTLATRGGPIVAVWASTRR